MPGADDVAWASLLRASRALDLSLSMVGAGLKPVGRERAT